MRYRVTRSSALLTAASLAGLASASLAALAPPLGAEPSESPLAVGGSGQGGAAAGGRAGGGGGGTGGSGRAGNAGSGGTGGSAGGDAVWPEGLVVSRMTSEHNDARASVVTADPLPALAWSPALASEARRWVSELARRCQGLEHHTTPAYGQNIASRASSGLDVRFSPAEAVGGWVAEGRCYERGRFGSTDRCDKACVAELRSTGCGHYTQIVWRTTRELGCAYASCDRAGMLVEYWVCNYSPPGNVRGREPY